MSIKNSFSVLLCNFKLVLKIFVFISIVLLIVAAVLTSILSPVLNGYFTQLQEETPLSPEEVLHHPIQSLNKVLEFFADFIKSNSDMVNIRLIYLGLVVIVSRFLLLLPIFPISKIMHQKMTCGFDVGLFNAFLSTLKQNILLSLVSAVVLGIVDMLIFFGAVYLTIWLFGIMRIISLPISLLITFSLYALRMALVSQIIPEYLFAKPKNVFKSVVPGIKISLKQFSKNFICIFVVLIIYFALIATTLIPTAGLMPIVLVPTIMVFHSSMYLILNYTYKRHKYFTDNGVTVYNPVKKY